MDQRDIILKKLAGLNVNIGLLDDKIKRLEANRKNLFKKRRKINQHLNKLDKNQENMAIPTQKEG